MSNITRNSLVVTGVLAALMAGNVALASDVPTEVTLIDKQTLVRNNGAEVQSDHLIKKRFYTCCPPQGLNVRHVALCAMCLH
ncbi:hypothetical protein NFL29_12985 [Escherichia coli]|nr:hypothetical protein [Escherichia coli]EQS75387.1 periplasmic oligopeptide-binding protein [Escherichia coli HVH 162 (4-5627982)]MCS2047881.1 hypothetical protein [Escherichia coli]MDQ8135005.1 hypothetical protein [Escherichia coli]WGB18644.1 hypothetical protein NFL29_12985 [Escherichia coli]